MTDSYNLPLVDGARALSSSAMISATDAYMRRPVTSDPRLHQLLPDTTFIEPPFTVAGLHAGTASASYRHGGCPVDSGHAVSALYTPDGTCAYQKRILACRLTLLDEDHPYSDTNEYHDLKLDHLSERRDREAYTDWVDSTVTEEKINGFKRTVFWVRKPILTAHTSDQRAASRPVLVTALVVQATPWGVIEAGTYQWPDLDPSVAQETVTTVADTLTHRSDRFSRPTPDDQWPLFYGSDMNKDELATAMRTTIAELADKPNKLKHEKGAVLTTLLDRFQADYDVSRREAREILEILDQRGGINDASDGLIKRT